MDKIHITLVGGQPYPVYLGIDYAATNTVILVCSRDTIGQAESLEKELANHSFTKVIIDPIDLGEISKEIQNLRKKIGEDKAVSINITGGPKTWSIAMKEGFANRENTQFFYIDQNSKLWDYSTLKGEQLKFNIDSLFRLYGNRPTKYKTLSDFTEDDFMVAKTIREIRNRHIGPFSELVKKMQFRQDLIVEHKDSSLKWSPNEKKFTIKIGRTKPVELKSAHVRELLLNTGWFELEVAQILSKWDKVKEMRLNCIFPSLSSNKDKPKNEIDIILEVENKLLFVECKTQIYTITDIDKFSSAVRNYGGLASKGLFITEEQLNNEAKEKCLDNNILDFSLKGSAHLNLDTDKMLYLLLNQEILNSNTK